jgi:hypothetical protein
MVMMMATIKQVEYLKSLLEQREWGEAVEVSSLSVGEASELIGKLKQAPKKLTDKQKARLEEYRLYEEAQAKAQAEQEERNRIEEANCERCKFSGGGPAHWSCLYGGQKIGHSRSHCSANACF